MKDTKYSYQNLVGYISRIIFIFGVPLIFVYFFIYKPLTLNKCFSFVSEDALNNKTVEIQVIRSLDQVAQEIKSLDPILPLNNDWFKFNVTFSNNFKVAIVTSKPDSYTEATTTFFLETKNGSSTIPYDQKIIINEVGSENLNSLITNLGFITNNKPIYVPGGSMISLQTNPNLGQFCSLVELSRKYKLLIYIESLIIFIGLLLITKEIISFIKQGFSNYFKL